MNEEILQNEEVIRIEDIIHILLKRWKMIVSITFSIVFMTTMISFFVIAPKYVADTKLFIGKENTKGEKYNSNDVLMYQKSLKTYAQIVATNDLVQRAIKADKLNVSSKEVLGGLEVIPREDTQILEIKYTSTDNVLAKNVLDSVTKEFIKSTKTLTPDGNFKIIESVQVPQYPVSPNKKMNVAIAFLIGLIISAGLVFLLEFMNDTFKSKDQLEQILGLPVIGIIPDDVD